MELEIKLFHQNSSKKSPAGFFIVLTSNV
ncbi:uncharacterized protein METZ01_LOCUS78454 [marine metagenome]|uniref:Uncharacterized protein n=1 Tax=marine metagenome TaxID=408172 RepID=A0A381UBM6_9ZZZZ